MILSPAIIHAGTRTLLWARVERLSPDRTAVAVFDAMARAALPSPDAAVALEDLIEGGERNDPRIKGGESGEA